MNDYPSQRWGRRFPGEPMLLDTCLLQHLAYVGDVALADLVVVLGHNAPDDRCLPKRLVSRLLGSVAASPRL